MNTVRRKLTYRQIQFAKLYAGEGTGMASAIAAGCSPKTAAASACMYLKNPEVLRLIHSRESREVRVGIATRKERQEFWTTIMRDPGEELEVRLKASEMLAKSEGDFLVRIDATVAAKALPEGLTADEVRAIARLPMSTEVETEGETVDAVPVTSGEPEAH